MPQPVAELEQPSSRVLAPDFVVGVEIGNVGEFLAHAQFRILAKERDRGLERTEISGEIEMLILRELLIWKDQHRISRERLFDP